MSDTEKEQHETPSKEIPEHLLAGSDGPPTSILMRLLEGRTSKRVLDVHPEDMGLAEHLPFPFMALVGQVEMRTALLLTVINPLIGGALLIGPRGTGKTTAARGLSDLLPTIEESTCQFGDMPEDYETLGPDGVCEECSAKLAAGETITRRTSVKLMELPLNARMEDVVGGINERIALQQNRVRLDRGILSRADRNLLYVDEVNLLNDEIVDAILDAAAQGHYTVRRGPMTATYRARLALIGSMNPEEGHLRPQILDRFGLRVLVSGLFESSERQLVYERVRTFRKTPRAFIHLFQEDTYDAREDIIEAQEILNQVELPPAIRSAGLDLVKALRIHSHRAEFALFEAARAYAAADKRLEVTLEDIQTIAPMALRMRRSEFIDSFFTDQSTEDEQIADLLGKLGA